MFKISKHRIITKISEIKGNYMYKIDAYPLARFPILITEDKLTAYHVVPAEAKRPNGDVCLAKSNCDEIYYPDVEGAYSIALNQDVQGELLESIQTLLKAVSDTSVLNRIDYEHKEMQAKNSARAADPALNTMRDLHYGLAVGAGQIDYDTKDWEWDQVQLLTEHVLSVNDVQYSTFIESVLLGHYVMPLIVYQDKLVVDGWKLRALHEFFSSSRPLPNPKDSPLMVKELEGKTYQSLPFQFQRRFDGYHYRVILISKASLEGIKRLEKLYSTNI